MREEHEADGFQDTNKATAFRSLFWLSAEEPGVWDYWDVAKSGNLYVRDFGATYTLAKKEDGFHGVAVGKGGARKDFGPFETEEQAAEALWPEGALRPIDPTL